MPITTEAELEAIYGAPHDVSTIKEVSHLTPTYRSLIDASPFLAMATVGPEGLDCSPRGDDGPVVRITDDRTVMLPDRRGNNRIDSLRNIVRDPRVALLFLIPGSGTTLRINGTAAIHTEPDLLESFAVDGKLPQCVVVVSVVTVYFQCARAVLRAGLWKQDTWPDLSTVPTAGQILADVSKNRIDGDAYDKDWPERARRASLW